MAYSASENLLGLSYEENGDWSKIHAHVTAKETYDFSKKSLADIKKEIFGKYATLLDPEYPDFLRARVAKTPFCIFWQGPINILTENNAITILAQQMSVSTSINKYSKYALIQAIKRYAPHNDIILRVSDVYRKAAIQAFRKYAGPNSHIIEFTEQCLKDYYLKYPSDQQSDLVLSCKWKTGTAASTEGFLHGTICASKKLVAAEIPPAHQAYISSIILDLAAGSNKDIEAVPYPFFDEFHGNNQLISEGAFVFLAKEEE